MQDAAIRVTELEQARPWKSLMRHTVVVWLIIVCWLASGASVQAQADGAGKLTVAIHVSSDGNRCYNPGVVAAIRHFTRRYEDLINLSGGIHGRELRTLVLDDFESADQTVSNVREALQDPTSIGMLGIPSSTRGRVVFDKLGSDIKGKAIPFITEMSLDEIFVDHPNVFTMASSVRNELEVVRQMIANGGLQRPVFVGLDNDLYSMALEEGVAAGSPALVGRIRVPVRDYQLPDTVSRETAMQIAALQPDLIVMSIHSGPTATLMGDLKSLGIDAPVLILLGRIASVTRNLDPPGYGGSISQIAREGVPNVYSERLRTRIWRSPSERWVFEDEKNGEAPGWQIGKCIESNVKDPRTIYDPANTRAVGRGTQYRDMLALIVETAKSAPKQASVSELRTEISERLRRFTEGRNVLKGLWKDWSFTQSRTAAGDTLLLTKEHGDDTIVLSPVQYQRINGRLQRTMTLYTSVDLIRLSHIDTNDQSFDAEFYLTMKSADNRLTINDIDFTNAFRAPTGNGKLLSFREIHSGDARSNFPEGVRLYKVSGRFMFEPELSRYPFDKQRFSVSFQPRSTSRPFLIQPPEAARQNRDVYVDGWRLIESYVGADQDIIPTIGQTLAERRIVPFYKFNATWVAERLAFDYYTRVIIPLGFILLVTYFSVFLPHTRFDSTMGIQVTALLSAIALYLALPKVDTDQATLSDTIFMFTYAAVSLMIGLSILKENLIGRTASVSATLVAVSQRVVFPIVVISVLALTLADEPNLLNHLADSFTAS
ncbi:MAG: ABC transporter substrate-binding protein [Filomicrobium sp.]